MNNTERQTRRVLHRLGSTVLLVTVLAIAAVTVTQAQEGRVVREKIHGTSLEKTLTGESADRNVSVYLPPSYDTSPTRRYPVVYLLHGITDTD